jgi:hypothetical protein
MSLEYGTCDDYDPRWLVLISTASTPWLGYQLSLIESDAVKHSTRYTERVVRIYQKEVRRELSRRASDDFLTELGL